MIDKNVRIISVIVVTIPIVVLLVYGLSRFRELQLTNDAVAFDTLIIALAALIVSVITLVAVLRQIVLAEKQLRLANDELKAVQADYVISQAMFKASNRKAGLTIAADVSRLSGLRNVGFSGQSPNNLRVFNSGDAVCNEFRCIVGLPPGYFLGDTPIEYRWDHLDSKKLTNEKYQGYSFYQKDFSRTIYPNDPLMFATLKLFTTSKNYNYDDKPICWRLIYQDGQNPEKPLTYNEMRTSFDEIYEDITGI